MKKEAMPQGTLARLLAHLEEEAYRIPLRDVLGTADRLRRARATAPSRAPDAQEPLPERESAEIARKGGGNHDSRNRDAIDHDSEEQSEALVLTQQR
jgi:hypothetical protein